MTKNTKYHKVTFLPENKSVIVENLKSVFETIIEKNPDNIELKFSCGAEGICQKCKIRGFQKMGPLTPTEKGCLSGDEIMKGIRLACQARVVQETEAEILYKEPFTVFHVNREIDIKGSDPRILKKIRFSGKDKNGGGNYREKADNCSTEVYFDDELINVEPGDTTGRLFAAGIDIGINTITVSLIDINRSIEIAHVVDTNPTINMGCSFEQRTEEVAEDRLFLELLCEELVLRLDVLIDELCRATGVLSDDICEIIICGSTGMLHLFFERACHSQKRFFNSKINMKAEDFHIYSAKKAVVTAVPSISNHLDSDFVSSIIASDMLYSDRKLFVYLGTETKAVVNLSGKLFASGLKGCEVYECVGLKFGMRTETGAIESVKIEEDIELSVIGESLPRGICGSGLMELAWQLKKKGAVDTTGRFVERAFKCSSEIQSRFVSMNQSRIFVLYSHKGEFESSVYISEEEMGLFLEVLTKTSVMIEKLLKDTQTGWDYVSTVIVGGAFARRVDKGVFSGLCILPEDIEKRLVFIESPSIQGLHKVLLNRRILNEMESIQENIVCL